jgi:hypothetical protein
VRARRVRLVRAIGVVLPRVGGVALLVYVRPLSAE